MNISSNHNLSNNTENNYSARELESKYQQTTTYTTTTTTTTGVFSGDMTISKIIARCEGAIKDNFAKYDFEAKTACSESEKIITLGWDQAKQKGQWITAQEGYRIDTCEQEISEIGGYMCNPINSKMIKLYRKATIPKGTWMERKGQRFGSADLDSIKIDKETDGLLTKTCGQCLNKKMISSGTFLPDTTKFVANILDNQSNISEEDKLNSDIEHSDYVNFETSNKKDHQSKDLAGIEEVENDEGGSSLPRNRKILTEQHLLNKCIDLFGTNSEFKEDEENSKYSGSHTIINIETNNITKYDSNSSENITFRNDAQESIEKVQIDSNHQIQITSMEHRSSRDSVPRDYRSGAMLFETENGVEKARLCDLDSSNFLNTQFQIQTTLLAEREIHKLQEDLERSSQKKNAQLDQTQNDSQVNAPFSAQLSKADGLSHASKSSRFDYEEALVETNCQPISSDELNVEKIDVSPQEEDIPVPVQESIASQRQSYYQVSQIPSRSELHSVQKIDVSPKKDLSPVPVESSKLSQTLSNYQVSQIPSHSDLHTPQKSEIEIRTIEKDEQSIPDAFTTPKKNQQSHVVCHNSAKIPCIPSSALSKKQEISKCFADVRISQPEVDSVKNSSTQNELLLQSEQLEPSCEQSIVITKDQEEYLETIPKTTTRPNDLFDSIHEEKIQESQLLIENQQNLQESEYHTCTDNDLSSQVSFSAQKNRFMKCSGQRSMRVNISAHQTNMIPKQLRDEISQG